MKHIKNQRGESSPEFCEQCGEWHKVPCPPLDEVYRRAKEMRANRPTETHPQGFPMEGVFAQLILREPRRAGFSVSRGAS